MVFPLLAAAPALAAGLGGAGAGLAGTAAAIPALAGAAGAGAAPVLAGGLGGAALTGAGGLGAGTAIGGAGAGGIAGGALGGAGMTGAGLGMGGGAAGAGAGMAAAPLAASQVGGTAAGLGGIGANPATAYVPQAASTKLMAGGMNPTLAKGLGGIADRGSAMFAKMGQNPMQSLGMASKLAQMGQGQQQQAPRAAPTGGGVNRALMNVDQGTADDIREQMGLADMGREGARIGRGMNRRIMAGGGRANARRIG